MALKSMHFRSLPRCQGLEAKSWLCFGNTAPVVSSLATDNPAGTQALERFAMAMIVGCEILALTRSTVFGWDGGWAYPPPDWPLRRQAALAFNTFDESDDDFLFIFAMPQELACSASAVHVTATEGGRADEDLSIRNVAIDAAGYYENDDGSTDMEIVMHFDRVPAFWDHVGPALKLFRIHRKILQEDLAIKMSELMGEVVHQSYISRIESGKENGGTGISFKRFGLICHLLGCKPSEVIERAEALAEKRDEVEKFHEVEKLLADRLGEFSLDDGPSERATNNHRAW